MSDRISEMSSRIVAMSERVKSERVILKGENGYNYCVLSSVAPVFHMSKGNDKVGPVACLNFPIEYTCNHACECYKLGLCYACGGCYQYGSNQQLYSENYKYFLVNTVETVASRIVEYITVGNFKLCRYFTCGDIPNSKFIDIMIRVAKLLPGVKFWAYTKKYKLVNRYVKEHNGLSYLPDNLTIVFSHWLNRDGTYYDMLNPYKFPTSEFIPIGKEELIKTVTWVCPCSDPTVNVKCATCEHGCYNLKHGQSMALLEHSTKETKQRDKALREAKKALATK